MTFTLLSVSETMNISIRDVDILLFHHTGRLKAHHWSVSLPINLGSSYKLA